MNIIPRNKKAESMTGWFQGILLVLLIVVVIGVAVLGGSDGMNQLYSKNHSTGMDTSAMNNMNNFSKTVTDKNIVVEGGEVEQTNDGLSLKQTFSIIVGIFSLLGKFLSGGFINNLLTNILHFPEIVGRTVQVLFLGGLILLIVRLFMKVRA